MQRSKCHNAELVKVKVKTFGIDGKKEPVDKYMCPICYQDCTYLTVPPLKAFQDRLNLSKK